MAEAISSVGRTCFKCVKITCVFEGGCVLRNHSLKATSLGIFNVRTKQPREDHTSCKIDNSLTCSINSLNHAVPIPNPPNQPNEQDVTCTLCSHRSRAQQHHSDDLTHFGFLAQLTQPTNPIGPTQLECLAKLLHVCGIVSCLRRWRDQETKPKSWCVLRYHRL